MGPVDYQIKCKECEAVVNKRANSRVEAEIAAVRKYNWKREDSYSMLCPDHKDN